MPWLLLPASDPLLGAVVVALRGLDQRPSMIRCSCRVASARTSGWFSSKACLVSCWTISFGIAGPNIFLIGKRAAVVRTKALLPRLPMRKAPSNLWNRPHGFARTP